MTTRTERDQVAEELRRLVQEIQHRRENVPAGASIAKQYALEKVWGEAAKLFASSALLVQMVAADED